MKSRIVSAFLLAAPFGVAVVWLALFGGRLEGQFFPVVSEVEITRAERDGDTHSLIWGTFNLNRDNCGFGGIEWVLVGVKRDVLLDLDILEEARERFNGPQEFGPWRLQASLDQIPRTKAVVYHDCNPLYKTETEFYP